MLITSLGVVAVMEFRGLYSILHSSGVGDFSSFITVLCLPIPYHASAGDFPEKHKSIATFAHKFWRGSCARNMNNPFSWMLPQHQFSYYLWIWHRYKCKQSANDHVMHPFTTPIRIFLIWRIPCVISSQMAPCYTGLELVTTMQCRAIRRSLPHQIIFVFMYYHYRFYILSLLFIYVVLLMLCMVGSLFCFCNLLPHYSSQHLQLLPTNGIKSYLSHWCFYTRYTTSFVILSLNYDYEYY